MKLITISGLDGSGKTSQLVFLSDHLKDKGKNVFMYHAVRSSLATKISNLLKKEKAEKENSLAKAKTSAGFFAVSLRKIFLIIDVILFKNFYKKLKEKKIDFILSDRYFYDQIVNIFFLEKKEALELEKWWVRLALKLMNKPDHSVFLKVSPLTVLSREREIEQGTEYLEKKFSLYEQLVKNKKTAHTLIDGEQSKTEVLEDIKKVLKL